MNSIKQKGTLIHAFKYLIRFKVIEEMITRIVLRRGYWRLGRGDLMQRIISRRGRAMRRVAPALGLALVVGLLSGGCGWIGDREMVTDDSAPTTVPQTQSTAVTTLPLTTMAETPPVPGATDRRVIETTLGRWVWTYAGEGWQVFRELLPERRDDGPLSASVLSTVPIPQIDGMEWWSIDAPESATFEEVTITAVPIEGHVDWSGLYSYDAGRVEGWYGSLSDRRPMVVEAPAVLRIVAIPEFRSAGGSTSGEPRVIAVLEVRVVPGDPEAVEFRDQDTGNLVLRLEATDPQIPIDHLVRAGQTCEFFSCLNTQWRLFVDGDDPSWVDPPWLGVAADTVAVAAGADGFVVAAVRSGISPTLYSWRSRDGITWEELAPPRPTKPADDSPVGAFAGRGHLILRTSTNDDKVVVVMTGPVPGGGWSVVWVSAPGLEWRSAQNPFSGAGLDDLTPTPFGWLVVAGRAGVEFDTCEVWVSVDMETWERVPGPVQPSDALLGPSQCHVFGSTVVLGITHVESEDVFTGHYWRGGFEGE
jgi:hypothetical protein